MKSAFLVCVLVVFSAAVASAQDFSKVDLFAGYSFVHVSTAGQGANFNGGSASFAYNPTPWLGLVGDFGGYHGTLLEDTGDVYSYLFGPRVNLRQGKITPFAQGLFGGSHLAATGLCIPPPDSRTARPQGTSGCVTNEHIHDDSFAMTLGGGLDWNGSSRISIRLAQVEYLMTRFEDRTQNGVRFSTGVVIHF